MAMVGVRQPQFISFSGSLDGAVGDKHRHAVHSHAARAAHARARHLRMREFQAKKVDRKRRLSDGEEMKVERIPQESTKGVEGGRNGSHAVVATLPSPLELLPADRRDPFDSFGMHFGWVEHFLLDHYVVSVTPHLRAQCIKLAVQPSYADRMSKELIRLALGNIGFLTGILLTSSRHLSTVYERRQREQQEYTRMAIAYKLSCLQDLQESISESQMLRFSDSIISQVMMLTLDEISQGNLTMARHHMWGAVRMVELNGGSQTLGLDGYIEILFNKFASEVGLFATPPGYVESPPCGNVFGATRGL